MKPRMVTLVLLALAQTGCRGCLRPPTADEAANVQFRAEAEPSAPNRAKPSETGSRGRVVDIEGAGHYTCALTDVGDVYCWGTMDADLCQGECKLRWDSDGPQQVQPLPPVRQIEVSLIRAAAVAANGQVYAWGLSVAPFYLPGEP